MLRASAWAGTRQWDGPYNLTRVDIQITDTQRPTQSMRLWFVVATTLCSTELHNIGQKRAHISSHLTCDKLTTSTLINYITAILNSCSSCLGECNSTTKYSRSSRNHSLKKYRGLLYLGYYHTHIRTPFPNKLRYISFKHISLDRRLLRVPSRELGLPNLKVCGN